MEESKTTKINFFKKVWYSVTKFEKYPEMAAEGIGSAIKYLIILSAIVTIFLGIGSIIEMTKVVGNLAEYIKNNIPEFTYEDGKVSMDIDEPITIEDVEYSGIDRIVVNPLAETQEEKNKSKEDNNINGTTIFFFKDQIILKNKNEENEINEQPYTYQDFITNYTQENIKSFNKSELIEYMTSEKMNSYYMRYAISIVMYLVIVNILVALLDTLELAVLGWVTTIVARIKMRFVAIYNMAIYALTLPMMLNIIYIVINYFTKFTISYFQIAYITIAYVYLAAVIFILKDDLIKRQEEVDRIKQAQEKVKEELKRQEEEKKEEKPEKKKEDKKDKKEEKQDGNNGEEPTGSEA